LGLKPADLRLARARLGVDLLADGTEAGQLALKAIAIAFDRTELIEEIPLIGPSWRLECRVKLIVHFLKSEQRLLEIFELGLETRIRILKQPKTQRGFRNGMVNRRVRKLVLVGLLQLRDLEKVTLERIVHLALFSTVR
jgi:hypothetical protein